ncbi:serine/threonine-protein kinase RsbW [Actinopolyspora xinjiangensis]|uniref:Serine/threonine-protein kinase RsbW n=1 Tax=Actinopolyspora xinjiangensis TaxID=405564 RepID=A0A1H0SLH3_9ACTN|nr:ATP-binding protein [Actinopolyspora xinjiangensis]SDP42583.1 serine/threonine-protein kinase RsbW [Actinopolyspora xinjiangensis]
MSASHPDRNRASLEHGAPSGEPSEAVEDSRVVEVRVAAEATQLPVMRAVVGDLAMRADFDVDTIADLRLAVDEACSSLVRIAAERSPLVGRFRTEDDRLDFTAEVTSDDPSGPRKNTFSWRVLGALTDSVASSVREPENSGDGHVVRIELSKGRMVHG